MADIQQIDMLAQFTGGTEAVWNSLTTPVPDRMLTCTTDTLVMKLGDGVTLYPDLPVFLDLRNLTPANHTHIPSEVGLGNVSNFPLATDAEAKAGVRKTAYMTPYLTRLGIVQAITDLLATDVQAVSSENNENLMTPHSTDVAILTKLKTIFGVTDFTQGVGWQTIYFPAAAFSDPVSDLISGYDGLDNTSAIAYASFVKTNDSVAELDFLLPACCKPTSIKFQLHLLGTHTDVAKNGTALFEIAIKSLVPNAAPTVDTWTKTVFSSNAIGAGLYARAPIVTLNNSGLTANTPVRIRLQRVTTNVADTLTVPVGVIGLSVLYNTSKISDI